MRHLVFSLALAGIASLSPLAMAAGDIAAAQNTSPVLAPNTGKKPVNDREQFAYSIGYMNGQGSAEQIPDLDIDTFIRGFRDAFDRKESLLTPPERTAAVNRYKEQRLAQLQAELEAGASPADLLLIADSVTMEDMAKAGRLMAYPQADVIIHKDVHGD